MESYKEKYEQALEVAKETYDKQPMYREWLEKMFPELSGGEDEKVRQKILFLFYAWRNNEQVNIPNKKEVEKTIAWLEKQGEQKPILDIEIPFGAKDSELQETTYYIPKGYYAKIEGDKVVIKQGEQKSQRMISAEAKEALFDYENANIQQKDFAPKEDTPRYNIGDVLCDKSCTTLSKEAQSNFEITDIRNGMYICDKCSFPISQQDEYELVAKRIEQKPNPCDGCINRKGCINCENGELREAEQKPTDEEMKTLLRTEYEKGRADAIAEIQKRWKPSDEQMQALKHAFNDGSITYKEMEILGTLYEQLKALHHYEWHREG